MRRSQRGHETFEHTADMGLRGWGPDESSAICETAAALLELMSGAIEKRPDIALDIDVEADSLQDLLVELLNELISIADLNETVFVRIVCGALESIEGKLRLKAVVSGIAGSREGDRPGSEVKAAARFGAAVSREKTGLWVASCVVDV